MIITFDLDGTLIRGPFIAGVFPVIATLFKDELQHQGQLVPNQFAQHLQQLLLKEHRRRDIPDNRSAAYNWDDIVSVVAQRFGIVLSIDIVKVLHQTCRPDTCWLKPGAKEVLSYLAQHNQPMYVLTNGFKKYQEIIIRYLGIDTFFDDIIAPDTTGFAKPDREIFEIAKSKDPTKQVYHVGDNLLIDVAGARQAGCKTILVSTSFSETMQLHPPAYRALTPEYTTHIHNALANNNNHFLPPTKACQADYVVTNLQEIINIYHQFL